VAARTRYVLRFASPGRGCEPPNWLRCQPIFWRHANRGVSGRVALKSLHIGLDACFEEAEKLRSCDGGFNKLKYPPRPAASLRRIRAPRLRSRAQYATSRQWQRTCCRNLPSASLAVSTAITFAFLANSALWRHASRNSSRSCCEAGSRFVFSFMRSPTTSATSCARWRHRSRSRIDR
jgi:hypothetical protein